MGERDILDEQVYHGEILPPEPEPTNEEQCFILVTGVGGPLYVGILMSQMLRLLVISTPDETFGEDDMGLSPMMPRDVRFDRADDMLRRFQQRMDETRIRREEIPRVIVKEPFVSLREQEQHWAHDRFGRKHRGRKRK